MECDAAVHRRHGNGRFPGRGFWSLVIKLPSPQAASGPLIRMDCRIRKLGLEVVVLRDHRLHMLKHRGLRSMAGGLVAYLSSG